jgi:serine/threonine-protein kinase
MAVLVLAAAAPPVHAQTASDKAAAEALFDQGRAAMQDGDFGKACGLLERSQHIEPGVGTLLYLAECYEKSGRTASAWATFREAADAADAAKESVRARTGRDRAARLEPTLSRLTIQVGPDAQQIAGLTVERNGRPVQSVLWNVPVPVDPSDYEVRAMAPGYEPWSQTVSVPERAAKVAVAVPPLKRAPEIPSATPADAPKSSTAPMPAPSPVAPSGSSPGRPGEGQRSAAYVVGAVGIVGVGIGTIFGLRAINKNSDAKTHCLRGYECDDAEGPALADDAKSAARLSNIAFGAGAALLVGGAILYFTSPRAPEGSSLRAGLGPRGITLGGTFQ